MLQSDAVIQEMSGIAAQTRRQLAGDEMRPLKYIRQKSYKPYKTKN